MDRGIFEPTHVVRVKKRRRFRIHWETVVWMLIMASFGTLLYMCSMIETMPKSGLGN